jgi:hypothetical protein
MALRTNDLQVAFIICPAISDGDNVIYLVTDSRSTFSLAHLAQPAIALEYALAYLVPLMPTLFAERYEVGHLFSSQPLRICRPTARYVLRCWVTTFRRVGMQKARDPFEMAGLEVTVTACVIYTILV